MNPRLLAWKAGGIVLGLALVGVVARGGLAPAWKSNRHARTERDSLERRLAEVHHSPKSEPAPASPVTDPVASVRAQADSAKIELRGLETTKSGDDLEISLEAQLPFSALVPWVGELESPRLPCEIRRWYLHATDPLGGTVLAKFDLECRGP